MPTDPTPLDALLAALAQQDQQRRHILRAMQTEAPSACKQQLSVQNYFQNKHQQAQRAHFFLKRKPKPLTP